MQSSRIPVTPVEQSRLAQVDFDNLGFGSIFSDHRVQEELTPYFPYSTKKRKRFAKPSSPDGIRNLAESRRQAKIAPSRRLIQPNFSHHVCRLLAAALAN
jgi:hypothetical protein